MTISCSVEECIHNDAGICGSPEGISIEDMCSCIEVHCGYEVEEETET